MGKMPRDYMDGTGMTIAFIPENAYTGRAEYDRHCAPLCLGRHIREWTLHGSPYNAPNVNTILWRVKIPAESARKRMVPVPCFICSTAIRAAGFNPRDAEIAVAAATFVNSRRLKPSARRVGIVIVFVKHGNSRPTALLPLPLMFRVAEILYLRPRSRDQSGAVLPSESVGFNENWK